MSEAETKFTPGPWKIHNKNLNYKIKIRDSTGDTVCVILPAQDDGCTLADASLIAAAPELYEALQAMTAAFRLYVGHEADPAQDEVDAFKLARAALAKAVPA